MWNTIANIGISPNLAIHEQKKIRLINQIVGFVCIFTTPVLIIQLILGYTIPSIHSASTLVLLSPILWFHHQKLYQIARYSAIISTLILISIHGLVYGFDDGSKYFILYTFLVSLVIFEKKLDFLVMLILHFAAFFIGIYFQNTYDPIFQILHFEYLSFGLTIILTFFAINFFKSEQIRIEGETKELIETINNKNNAIRTQQRMLRYQNDALKTANEELEDTQKSMKDSVEDLRTFAYIVSHDLKEPLRMINSYTQLIKRRLKGQLNEETEEFMFYIVDGTKRMKTLLDDLLKYATTTNKEEEKEPVGMKDIIDIAIKNLEIPIYESKAQIIINDNDFMEVHGSFSQLSQLFQNIIGNAIKFHRPNDTPTIIIDMERNKRYNIYSIQDNGIGIPSDKVDKIFSPFERVGNKEKYKGSGIVLAICKKIVQNHDGKIWVDSDINQGATFFIAFPVLENKEATEE